MLIRSRPGIAPLRSALARWSPGPRPSICHDPLRSSAQRVVTGVAPDPIGGRERSAPDFARDDNRVVLGLLVDRAGRSARSRADRASDDGPDGPADDRANDGAGDSTSDRPTGLFVTVRGPGHVVFLDRFAWRRAGFGDRLLLDDSILSHDSVSLQWVY